jgi:hypothetical protein
MLKGGEFRTFCKMGLPLEKGPGCFEKTSRDHWFAQGFGDVRNGETS